MGKQRDSKAAAATTAREREGSETKYNLVFNVRSSDYANERFRLALNWRLSQLVVVVAVFSITQLSECVF